MNDPAGGLWQPEAAPLAKLRNNIDRKPHKIKSVLAGAGLRKDFLDGVANNEQKVVKAFVEKNKESMLKTKPKVSNSFRQFSAGHFKPAESDCYGIRSYHLDLELNIVLENSFERPTLMITTSQGYSQDHRDLNLLRLRNYTVMKGLTDEEILNNPIERIGSLVESLVPFVSLNPSS